MNCRISKSPDKYPVVNAEESDERQDAVPTGTGFVASYMDANLRQLLDVNRCFSDICIWIADVPGTPCLRRRRTAVTFNQRPDGRYNEPAFMGDSIEYYYLSPMSKRPKNIRIKVLSAVGSVASDRDSVHTHSAFRGRPTGILCIPAPAFFGFRQRFCAYSLRFPWTSDRMRCQPAVGFVASYKDADLE